MGQTKPLTRERLERLEKERVELDNSFGQGGFIDGLIRDRIAYIDKVLKEGVELCPDRERR